MGHQKGQSFSGVEMKVEITNLCRSGRCRFCSPLFRPSVEEVDTEEFLERFERNFATYLAGGGRRVILTGGGEPSDAPRKLFGALRIIQDRVLEAGVELELLTVYSNGVGLLSPMSTGSKETVLDGLVAHGVKDLNLSIHGLTSEKRTDISGIAMGRIDFERLLPEVIYRGMRVMTRTTLARDGIDSIKKVEEFVEWVAGLGVRIAYFSDLFRVPIRNERTTPGSQTVLQWTDDHRIDFEALLVAAHQSPWLRFVEETTRHADQGRTFSFLHVPSGISILFGDLVIGNEVDSRATYAYVKADGSMGDNNNISGSTRAFVDTSRLTAHLRKYRPGRNDI